MDTGNRITTNDLVGNTGNLVYCDYVDNATLERWKDLFHYDTKHANAAILAHRSDPSVRVSDEAWAWVQWGHEKADFDREAYEHLHMLKNLYKRYLEKIKARNKLMVKLVGDYWIISLEGYLTLDILTRILGEGETRITDSEKKLCAVKIGFPQEGILYAWFYSFEKALSRGKYLYNKVWRDKIEEKSDTELLVRAGFYPVLPSSHVVSEVQDIRVNFLRLDQADQPGNLLEYASLTPARSPSPEHRIQTIYSIAEVSILRPSSMRQALPTSQWPASALPATPSRNAGEMRRFLRQYRTQPHLRLPEFGNAPRVFPLPGEVVAVRSRRRTGRNIRSQPVTRPEATSVSPSTPDETQIERPSPATAPAGSTDRRYRQIERQKRRNLLYETLAEEITSESRDRYKAALFEDDPQRTVSNMMIRHLVLAKNLVASTAIGSIKSKITSDTSEIWSQYLMPRFQGSGLQRPLRSRAHRSQSSSGSSAYPDQSESSPLLGESMCSCHERGKNGTAGSYAGMNHEDKQ